MILKGHDFRIHYLQICTETDTAAVCCGKPRLSGTEMSPDLAWKQKPEEEKHGATQDRISSTKITSNKSTRVYDSNNKDLWGVTKYSAW